MFVLYLCKAVLACALYLCGVHAARAKYCCSEIVLSRPVLCWSGEIGILGPGVTDVTFSILYHIKASPRAHLRS
jgi:hypothetical protein